ncbi:MAG: phosphoribosylformylglycinamidine cyclo-ligase [Acidimicrobiia bacterium]
MTTYEEAGVDLEGAERHVRDIAASVTSTWGEGVVGAFGGFAAGVELPPGYRNPVLMMSTDGVGTKLEIARRFSRWEGIGQDLVAMCVDDLAAVGARPIGFVDYMAVGSLQPERDGLVVTSVARACSLAGCPLLGGETAEHPGVMGTDAIDLAGAVVGVVEKGQELRADRVNEGDIVIGLASPNLRSNGFSLVRRVLEDDMEQYVEDLLDPSVIYTPSVLAAVGTGWVRAAAHVTGGGLIGNLGRALPDHLGVEVHRSNWDRPEIFDVIAMRGVSPDEMERTFNLGIGFCLVVDPVGADVVMGAVAAHHPVVIGTVNQHPGVRIV